MKHLITLWICSLILISCSNSTENANSTANSSAIVGTITPQPFKKRGEYNIVDIMTRFSAFQTAFSSSYDKVLYASFIDNQLYVFVLKGKWDDSNLDREKKVIKKGGYQIGLVNEKNEVVIPIKYDKIYNLGATASNLIEVELSGKLGAYDLEGHEVLPTEFDAIYPYKGADNVWVQVRKGEQYGWLSKDGGINLAPGTHQDVNLFQAPAISSLISSWSFNSDAETLQPIFEYVEVDNQYPDEPIEGSGILFTPSYLFQLGIVPEFQHRWLFNGGDFGHESTVASVQKTQALSNGISALMTTFDESFMDARGYNNENKEVVTVNNKMEKMDKLSFSVKGYNDQKACSSDILFNFIGTDVLEVCKQEPTEYDLYSWAMTTYNYYKIGAEGKITEMTILGDFKFTRVVKMTEKYVEGCYARDLTKAEEATIKEDEYVSFVQSNHLTIEDLDLMRNEIYAAHGYKFKNAKLQAYFGKKSWYKPQFDTVDDKLSEIEKHNIQVILDIKKKMEGNEAKYVTTEFGTYAPAG